MHLEKEWRKDLKTHKQCRQYVEAVNLTNVLEFISEGLIPDEKYLIEAMKELEILKEFADIGWRRVDTDELIEKLTRK